MAAIVAILKILIQTTPEQEVTSTQNLHHCTSHKLYLVIKDIRTNSISNKAALAYSLYQTNGLFQI